MKLLNKIEQGFTLPEVAASMTIMSVVLMSVLYITGEASYFFNREMMREEIQHYGNTVLDEIVDQMSTAPEINVNFSHNSRKIACVFDTVSYVYTGDRYSGVLKDGKPLDILRFNKTKSLPYTLELMEFDCTSAFEISETWDPKLRESIYNVELVIDALYNKNDIELRQRFEFSRRVFARSKFANA
tara:strand:- start:1436 stop:1993 length:558 start_codon:yes stop_codon:yes gene_type:complete